MGQEGPIGSLVHLCYSGLNTRSEFVGFIIVLAYVGN